MRVIRFFLKIALLPVILIVTMIQWFGTFIIGFSSIVFNILAGLFFLVAVLSYLMGLSAGAETAKIVVAGFVIFMIPIVGEWLVGRIIDLNLGMRDFIRS